MSTDREPAPTIQQYAVIEGNERLQRGRRCIDALFAELQETASRGELPNEEQLSSLSVLFGTTLPRALELVEADRVHCYTSDESTNRVYTVTSTGARNQETVYIVLPHHYCKCDSFEYHVMSTRTQIYCKHILAVWLANALQKCNHVAVDDEELHHILLEHM